MGDDSQQRLDTSLNSRPLAMAIKFDNQYYDKMPASIGLLMIELVPDVVLAQV